MAHRSACSFGLWTFFVLLGPVLSQLYIPSCAAKCANNIIRSDNCESDPTCFCTSLVHEMLADCACYTCNSSDIAAVNAAVEVVCPNNFSTNVTCSFLSSTTPTGSATVSATLSSTSSPAATSGSAVSTTDVSSTGLSTGAKAGIGAGVGGGVILIAFIALFAYRKGRASSQTKKATADQKDALLDGTTEPTEPGSGNTTALSPAPAYVMNELSNDEKKTKAPTPGMTELGGNREAGPRYAEMTTLTNSHEKPTMQGNSHELGGDYSRYANVKATSRGFAELPTRQFE